MLYALKQCEESSKIRCNCVSKTFVHQNREERPLYSRKAMYCNALKRLLWDVGQTQFTEYIYFHSFNVRKNPSALSTPRSTSSKTFMHLACIITYEYYFSVKDSSSQYLPDNSLYRRYSSLYVARAVSLPLGFSGLCSYERRRQMHLPEILTCAKSLKGNIR